MNRNMKTLRANDDLESFYDFGKQIRARNTDNSGWSEAKELGFYFNANNENVQFFLIEKGEERGRIAAFYHEETPELGILGWYECDDNDSLSEELLRAAISWLQSKGCKKIIGPINGSTWSSYRFNLDASKPLFAGEPYQPSYYPKQWEKVGFENDVMYETTIPYRPSDESLDYDQVMSYLINLGLEMTPLAREITEDENLSYFKFYADCFRGNPFFYNISLDHYLLLTEKLANVAEYDFSYVVKDKQGNPISAFISYVDVHRGINDDGKGKKLFLKTIATHPKWRNKKIMQIVVNFLRLKAERMGYTEVIFSLMFSENLTAMKTRDVYGSDILRNYTLMSKELG
ncbi:MAG: GNAT superfamily N-acetyltransferase [Flavobacteriaceae bacterium]|jgi:GNAT superfamily N-acetyltransferase